MTLDTLLALASLATPLSIGAAFAWRRIGQLRRTVAALERAVERESAQHRGVILLVRRAGSPTAQPLLREIGWQVAVYESGEPRPNFVTGNEGSAFRRDCRAADVVLFEGLTAEEADLWSQETRTFRELLPSGASVVLFTPAASVRYDLTRWGELAQGVTVPRTALIACHQAIALRRELAALRGVRPGDLAEARAALPS